MAKNEIYKVEDEQPVWANPDMSPAEEALEYLQGFWAAEKDPKKLWDTCQEKRGSFYNAMNNRGLPAMMNLAYQMYYGFSDTATNSTRFQTQTLSYAGEDGELLELSVNELRSFWDQIINMMVKNRPSFEAQATNTDATSMSGVESADTVVTNFYEQAFGERQEKEVAKIEAMYGKAFLHVEWDSDGGDDVEVEEMVPSPAGDLASTKTVKSGTLHITRCYPWNVAQEPYQSEFDSPSWRLVRVAPRSKFEMVARFPTKKKEIESSAFESQEYEFYFPDNDPTAEQPEDMCDVWIFYHARTAALPEGRKVMFANGVCVKDEPLPLDVIPVLPFMSSELHGTCFGVSDLWNMIPLEQLQNQITSNMATNIEAFGNPALVLPRDQGIDIDALANGQKVVWMNAGDQMPAPIQFPTIPPVSFQMLGLLRNWKQSISGLNAVARGDTSDNIKSGSHAALYAQQAVEAQSPRAAELDILRERTADIIVSYLKKYAVHPQLVAMVGIDERDYLKSFTQKDVAGVKRIKVKTASPLMRTQAGRMQVVELMLKSPGNLIKDPQQMIQFLEAGQMKPLYQLARVENLHIQRENEELRQGPPVQQDAQGNMVVPSVRALITENAKQHITNHLEVLYSPEAKKNPAIRDAVMAHIMDHTNVARNGDPYLAALLGIPGPQQDSAPGGEQPGGGNARKAPPQQTVTDTEEVLADGAPEEDQPRLPKPAQSPLAAQN